jgi:hypothetical protein
MPPLGQQLAHPTGVGAGFEHHPSSKVSGMATSDRTTLFEVADAAIEAIASGEYERAPIERLSRICHEYMPGVWAAR